MPVARRIVSHPSFSPAILALSLLSYVAIAHRDLYERLDYPPTSDQLMYLAGVREFAERFLFFWRSPLYGLWMGGFYLLSGHDERLCFYLEKYTSMCLLGLTIAYLGQRLFDTPSGLLMGIWALSCKYLVVETNGSHILAAALFALSLLSFTLASSAARLPMAMLMLLLSTQVRSEMWVPLIVVAIILLSIVLNRWRMKRHDDQAIGLGSRRSWLVCAAVGITLILLFNLRLSPPEPHRLSEAFAINFTMNYIDRLNLRATKPADDLDWMKLWVTTLPGVSTSADAIKKDRGEIHPLDAVIKYPDEFLAHVSYNLKLFIRAFPATILAFDRPGLMFVVFLFYLMFYIFRGGTGRPGRWAEIPNDARFFLFVWSIAILSLIPISFILRVVAHYYIQLMPILITFAMFSFGFFMNKIRTVQIKA